MNPVGRALLLYGVILPFRPKKSAAAYRAIWTPEGSPLLLHSEALARATAHALGPALRWEPSRGGALFPHLYRRLRLADVVWDKSLPLGATGHIFPEGLL